MEKHQSESISKQYLETKSNFEWFIIQYFGNELLAKIDEAANENNDKLVLSFLSNIWFKLPDNKFNIIENPKGWREFLNLIEN